MNQFPFSESLQYGFRAAWKHLLLVVFSTLVWSLLAPFLYLGYLKLLLEIKDKDTGSFSTLFSSFTLVIKSFFSVLLYSVVVSVGLAFLVVPGLIFAGRLMFFPFFIVDKNAGIIDAFKMSWAATAGHTLISVGYFFAIHIIAVAGSILLGVGIFYTTPAAFLAVAYTYRVLSSESMRATHN